MEPQVNKQPNNSQIQPAKPSLWEEIVKGWEWVVFTWKMLQRMGGIGAIARTLGNTLALLLKRTLAQWGFFKNKN